MLSLYGSRVCHVLWLVCVQWSTATGILTYAVSSRSRSIQRAAFAVGVMCDVGLLALSRMCGVRLAPVVDDLREQYMDGLTAEELAAEIAQYPLWCRWFLRLMVCIPFPNFLTAHTEGDLHQHCVRV